MNYCFASKEQVESLPRWAVIALAIRYCRRLLPYCNSATSPLVSAIVFWTDRIAASSYCGPVREPLLRGLSQAALGVGDEEQVMEETYFGCSTRTAYAAGYLAQAVAEAFDPDVDSVETALHSIRDAEMAVADAPEGYLWSEIKDDYEALAKAVASGRWDGDTRVSQDVFPSLGPDEV